MEIAIDDLDHPNMKRVMEYWGSLRGDRFAPSWKEVDLMALGAEIIPFVTVVDVQRDPLDFVFRFWGTAHVRSKGIEKTGKSILEPPVYREASPFEEFRKVTEEKRPLAVETVLPIPAQDWKKVPITVLRLPLSDDGREVDRILSYSMWQAD